MEGRRPKQKRSFKFIIRFFQIIFTLIFVFLASFFITLSLNAENPKEHFFEVAKEIFSLMEDDKKNEAEKNTSPATQRNSPAVEKTSSTSEKGYSTAEKSSSPVTVSRDEKNLGLSSRIDRIMDVETFVKEKEKNIRPYILLEDMSNYLVQAIIAVEDARFYSHSGYDWSSIMRATAHNVESGEIEEGASTITQQLAKNLFLSQEQSFTRKVEELFLAMNIEKHFSKNKILELYLNTIYFGSNFYGIESAAEGYFGKKPKELTLAESAMLAGLPNAPSVYSPYVNFLLAKKRQLIVIDAMLKNKAISPRDAEKARIEEIVLVRE